MILIIAVFGLTEIT